jgi:hypothetical protein
LVNEYELCLLFQAKPRGPAEEQREANQTGQPMTETLRERTSYFDDNDSTTDLIILSFQDNFPVILSLH